MAKLRPKSSPWQDASGRADDESADLGFFKTASSSSGFSRKKNWQQKGAMIISASSGGFFDQASQSQVSFGRSSSASQLKTSMHKLAPLPKQPLTFENVYKIAKQRAITKNAGNRQAKLRQTSPSNSQLTNRSKQLTAMLLDTEGPEELAWASDTLAAGPTAEEDPLQTGSGVASREPGSKMSVAGMDSRMASKQRLSRSGSKLQVDASASQALAAQIASLSELQGEPVQRQTREQATGQSGAYVQALRVIMNDENGDFSKLDCHNETIAVAVAGHTGSIEARLKISVNGFSEEEVKRMKTAFFRFKSADGMEIHKDDLGQSLRFLGYMKVDESVCQELCGQITHYAMLDWQEYNDFVEKFAAYEREEFYVQFEAMDSDGSGQLSIEELKVVISSLGVTPFKETLKEAMQVVDFDGSGALDFEEFVHLMAVYRVTEGFTRAEVQKLKVLFDRIAVPGSTPGLKEVKPERLGDAMVHVFGPQSITLARKLALRFATGDFTDPMADASSPRRRAESTLSCPSPKKLEENEQWNNFENQPGLPFPEFLLWARRLREAEVAEFHKQFAAADLDDSGFIGPDEVIQVIKAVGYMPLRAVVEEVIAQVDVDQDNKLDFDEFVNLMAVFRKTDAFCAREIAELTEVFNNFKEEDGYGGYVNCLELMDVLRSMGYVTNLEHVRRFIKQVDFDSSNSLDLPEFIRLMRMHREVELNQAEEIFNEKKDTDGKVKTETQRLQGMLKKVGYTTSEEMLAECLIELAGDGNEFRE
jgi:Ca2+-binding EF-hand superfamily protein